MPRSAALSPLVAVLAAALFVAYVRVLPLSLAGAPPGSRDQLRYSGEDGRSHVYLGDYDSYLWLRHARTELRTGTTCDAVVDGECRDTFANAPVGAPMVYARSLHVTAIVALHRLLTTFVPGHPLPATAFWVPVIVGVVGVVPAFAIAYRLAGLLAGLTAAIVVGTNPIFLSRSIGSDNDVWNVVVPLFAAWAGVEALGAARLPRRALLAAVAGALVGVHAAVWRGWAFTFAVVGAGLVAGGGWRALSRLRRGGRVGDALVELGAPLAAFVVAAAASVTAAGAGAEMRALLSPLLPGPAAAAPAVATAPAPAWPDVLRTVGELWAPGLGGIANALHDQFYFFVAWLGLLVLLLPERGWRWWHFGIVIAGNYLYRYLLTAVGTPPQLVAGLLALPLAVIVGTSLVTDDSERAPVHPGAAVVVAWFLAGLLQAYSALRFVELLAAPFGILLGVALGRTHAWLARTVLPWSGAAAPAIRPLLFAIVAAALVLPAERGIATARAYLPIVHDAWWDTLTRLRDETPPDAIVTTWWDYGHWAKFIAERRVSADGSTLLTRVPHWIGRALLAPTEREAAGLLRMLDCGSDATPDGAYGRLVAHGVDPVDAHELLVAIASLDRDAARARLRAHDLSAPRTDDVLGVTHCTPPPGYLVLTSTMITNGAWRRLGSWDPKRAWLAWARETMSADALAGELERRFALAADTARDLVRQAATLRTAAETEAFVTPSLGYLVPTWLPCRDTADGGWFCQVGRTIDDAGTQLAGFEYRSGSPAESRWRLRATRGGTTSLAVPAALLLADGTRIHEAPLPPAGDERLAVLVDVPGRRVLVGPPDLLRSTFTRLMFLDPAYAAGFEKMDDRTGYRNERVVTWRIRDDALAGSRSAPVVTGASPAGRAASRS